MTSLHPAWRRSSILLVVLAAAAICAIGALADDAGQPNVGENHADPHRMDGHEQHVMHCEDCHTCEFPTRKDPCLVACPRYESHFFSEKQVSESPDVVIIDQLTDLYGPVVFAHRLHAEMGLMTGGCENCHHYSERDGEIPPCRQCHDAEKNQVDLSKPALKGAYHRQCINCHLDWSHENACGFCHDQVTEELLSAEVDTTDIIGIPHPMIEATKSYVYETTYKEGPVVTFHHADHVDQFGLQCVDCHRGDSCAACHDKQEHEQEAFSRTTSCYTCHGERDCQFCHKAEPMPLFNHATSVGWPLEPYHTQRECNDCHGTPGSFRHPGTNCTGCHIHWEDGAFKHSKVGLVLDEYHIDNDCSDCHIDMDFTQDPNCENCHDEQLYPDNLPGERTRR